jgi:hypothetical protein
MLGVGLGEPPDADFADFGDEADPRTRAAMLDEGLAVLDRLVRGERVDHDGEHLRVHAELRPPSVQRPRPPIFVAGTIGKHRPLQRSLTWDGWFPIGRTALLTPDDIAAQLEGVERPPGWELFTTRTPGCTVAEWADAGADWIVEGGWPVGDWVAELEGRIRNGPPTA